MNRQADSTSTIDDGSEVVERQRSMPLSDKEFSRLKEFIYRECGIKITEAKRTMVEARLQKRLRGLGLTSFSRYCDYLFGPRGMEEELVHLINVITTNKTDFFRESAHFHYLVRKALPEVLRQSSGRRTITVWSAGCSSGEEPYTLAMVLKEFVAERRGIDFLILATDISTKVLEKAKLAVYDEERIGPIPDELRKKYLLKSKDAVLQGLSRHPRTEGAHQVQTAQLHGQRFWI